MHAVQPGQRLPTRCIGGYFILRLGPLKATQQEVDTSSVLGLVAEPCRDLRNSAFAWEPYETSMHIFGPRSFNVTMHVPSTRNEALRLVTPKIIPGNCTGGSRLRLVGRVYEKDG